MPELPRLLTLAALVGAICTPVTGMAAARPSAPVIDMHVHAMITHREHPLPGCPGNQPLTFPAFDPKTPIDVTAASSCPRPIFSSTDAPQFQADTIRELRRAGVRRAVLIGSPDVLQRWQAEAPDLFIPADAPKDLSPQEEARLRTMQASGTIRMFAEIGAQYEGMRADDPRLDPFWSLAEERDVPVGIHLGMGMPYLGEPLDEDPYRAALTSPFQLETVIRKHPRLRIYAMHAGSPLIEEMIAMLFTYPTLYVDVSANDWNMPRPQFYSELKRLVDAGFEKRIMFGSDQTIWPQAIGIGIKTIQEAPFLTHEQKRDILYNNAARFLRLSKEDIARDHRR